jgi:hypothetical protein
MNPRVRQIVLVSVLLVSAGAIAFGIYYFFFRPVVAPEPTAPGVTPGGSLPGAGEAGERPPGAVPPGGTALPQGSNVANGGLTQTTELTDSAVTDITISSDGRSANYYDPEDGRFYRIDGNGNAVRLSETQFPQVSDVAWNGTGGKAVLEFPDGSNIVYDFAAGTQVTLPTHWQDFSFSPVSDQIAAKSIAVDPDNRWLVTTNADGSNVKSVQPLGLNADLVQVSWSPNDSVIAFADTAPALAGGLDRKMILPIGKSQENFKGLVVEGLGFTPSWSPDGKRLLYSVAGEYSDNKPLVWITDASPASMGENRRSVGLNTWADKCTFATASVAYCAVPSGLPANAGLQRQLYRTNADSLYKIDLANGRTTLVAVPANAPAMENLQVTENEGSLFYTNVLTGRLEKIQLR